MSSIKRVFLTFFACFILLFSFVVPSYAAEVDYTLPVNIPNPVSIGYDGYITIPYTNGTDTYLQVIFWKYFRTSTPSDADLSNQDVLCYIDFSSSTSGTASFHYLGDDIVGVSCHLINSSINKGNYTNSSDVVSDLSSYTFSFSCPSGYTYIWPQESSDVYDLSVISSMPFKSYSVVWGNNETYNQLAEIIDHFSSLLQKMDLTNEQLAEAVSKLNDIFDTVSSIDGTLADFVYYYWEQFTYYQLPEQFNAVNSRLDTIIRLLNKKGEIEQTTVDSSKVDEYLDIEQSLVNNDEAESALNEFDISIDGQSYNFIWTLITDILNSHPEVFGLIITILTLGFLALILNR